MEESKKVTLPKALIGQSVLFEDGEKGDLFLLGRVIAAQCDVSAETPEWQYEIEIEGSNQGIQYIPESKVVYALASMKA